MSKELSVSNITKTIETQLADKETVNALVTTVFKSFTVPLMRQALLEGMMRGFTFKNFLDKDVYAIKYGNDYSLVSSVDYSRKIAMQTGKYAGKSKPTYAYDQNGRIDTCEITVKRVIEGMVCDFAAEVTFSEYTTGKNQWAARPKTMIAKVAEMHALRMAFPEELSKAYIEEETTAPTKVDDAPAIDYIAIQEQFDACKTAEEVREIFSKLPSRERNDKTVVEMGSNRTKSLESIKDAETEEVTE